MVKKQLFILLVIYIGDSSCVINTLYDTGEEIWKLYSMMNQINLDVTPVVNDLIRDTILSHQETRQQMAVIYEKFDEMEKSMRPKLIRNLFKSLPLNAPLYKDVDMLELFIMSIDQYYDEFHKYMNESNNDSDLSSQNALRIFFVNVHDKILVIRRIVAGTEFQPSLGNLIHSVENLAANLHSELCDGRIISDILIQLFRLVFIAELKANMILLFENPFQFNQNAGWKLQNSNIERQFARQFGIYVDLFLLEMESIDTLYLRACDPSGDIWIRNESFYELEGTFQTAIFRYHWPKCLLNSCSDLLFHKQKKCSVGFYDDRSGCSGTLAECDYLNAIKACVLENGPHKFRYVNSTALGPLGGDFHCPENIGYIIEDGVGWNTTFSACACNCYGDHNKISLALMESNVNSNMVITGLRFLRKNQILYIQPMEAELGAYGHILENTEKWIPIPNNVNRSQIYPVNKDNKAFFLDDVHLPPNFILTGVRFNKQTRNTTTGFAIKIYGVPFDYESGRLIAERKVRVSRKKVDNDLGPGLSFKRISSVNTNLPHTPSSEGMKYVSLERSELRSDFGQSTLPLFDAVAIKTNPPSLLGGIGLFHKGVEGYAGFISLRVYAITYATYFTDFKFFHMEGGCVVFKHSQCI